MLIAIGKWVDVGIDPYRFLRRFSEYPGDCDRRESLEGATPVCALVRNDMRGVAVPACNLQINQESAERLRIPPILGKGYKEG